MPGIAVITNTQVRANLKHFVFNTLQTLVHKRKKSYPSIRDCAVGRRAFRAATSQKKV